MLFDLDDMYCKCGCGYVVEKQEQMDLVNNIFKSCIASYGTQPIITSWCRCEDHNSAVGGVPNSYHVQGIATDLYVPGVSIDKLASIAKDEGSDGIGKYYDQGFVHVDKRGYNARWEE